MTIKQAEWRCYIAAGASWLGALAYLLFAAFIMMAVSDGAAELEGIIDWTSFVVMAVSVFYGAGFFFKSRTIALIATGFHTISLSGVLFMLPRVPGLIGGFLVVGIAMLIFYWRGMRGAFEYVKMKRVEERDFRCRPKWVAVIGIIALVGVLSFSAVDFYKFATRPSMERIRKGEMLTQVERNWLVENLIIEENERVDLYFSASAEGLKGNGSFLTAERVIGYYRDKGGQLHIKQARYETVVDLFIEANPTGTADTAVTVVLRGKADQEKSGEDQIFLFLPKKGDGDTRFVARIEEETGLHSATFVDAHPECDGERGIITQGEIICPSQYEEG